LNWPALLYVFGIPLFAFGIDLAMRHLIRFGPVGFDEYCYGADLGLTGMITGISSLSEMQHRDMTLVSGVIFLSFFGWMMTMIIHRKWEPHLDSGKRAVRWTAKGMLFVVGNVVGMGSLAIVLWLMWKK
jgi:hypothetical protein